MKFFKATSQSDKQTGYTLLGWKLWLFLYALCLVLLNLFHNSNSGFYFEHELGHKIQSLIRQKYKLSPKIHPRIKIYALDDYAVNKLRVSDIPLAGWGEIIHHISKSKPSAIVIDKKFGLLGKSDNIARFRLQLSESSPVYIGAHTQHISTLDYTSSDNSLNLKRKEFKLSKYVDELEDADWLKVLSHNGFGPHKFIESSFFGVGHIVYSAVGRVSPFKRLSQNEIIPHLTLQLADTLKIKKSGVWVNGSKAYLDERELIPVNFPSVEDLYSNTQSLYPVMKFAQINRKMSRINEGDIVIILPLFFTGNADMGMTPLGELPRGYVIVSLINSVLQKQWLRPLKISSEAMVVAATLTAGAASFFGPIIFVIFQLLTSLLIFVGSIALYCFYNLIVPWPIVLLAQFFTGLVFFSIKMIRQAKISQTIETALSGLVSRQSLKELVKNPGAFRREASEQLLTIMFIDMVSFSNMAEKEEPGLVFKRLKKILGHFSDLVHKHGGVVDKTLGDGMLCFFGYHYIGGRTSDNHADQALACAIELQKTHVERNLQGLEQGDPLLPIRIGVNSAKVYIGDLGDKNRIDFTLIGAGVNFAQRLEAACEPFHILLADSTLTLSSSDYNPVQMEKRKVKIKHHKDLFDAIEYNPFFDDQQTLERVKAIRSSILASPSGIRAPRWVVHDSSALNVQTSYGPGKIINFSQTGMGLTIPASLKKGDIIEVEISASQVEVVKLLEEYDFPAKIKSEVRWVSSSSSGHSYGLRILGLSEEELSSVYFCLQRSLLNIDD